MAKEKKIITKRKVESVRERATKQIARSSNPRRKRMSAAARKPAVSFWNFLFQEFQLFKLPNNKLGNILSKRRTLTPSYLVNSFKELRLVSWPSRRQAVSLSAAVIVFSVVIAVVVQLLDFGLGKLFREVILK